MTCVESVDTRSKIGHYYELEFSWRTPGLSSALKKRVFFQLWHPKGPSTDPGTACLRALDHSGTARLRDLASPNDRQPHRWAAMVGKRPDSQARLAPTGLRTITAFDSPGDRSLRVGLLQASKLDDANHPAPPRWASSTVLRQDTRDP